MDEHNRPTVTPPGESQFFRAWTQWVLNHRAVCVLLLLATTLGFLHQLKNHLRVDTSPEYFTRGGSDTLEVLETFREDFGRDNLYIVLVEGDVFSPSFLERLRTLHTELEEFEADLGEHIPDAGSPTVEAPVVQGDVEELGTDDWGEGEDWGDDEGWAEEEAGGRLIEEVTSLINFRQTVFEDGSIRVRGLLDVAPNPDELSTLREQCLSDPNMVGRILGAQGTHAVLAVRSQTLPDLQSRRLQGSLEEMVVAHQAEGFDVQVTGMPALDRALTETLTGDMKKLGGSAILLMAIVLLVLFRHPAGVIGPIIVIVLSIVWTLGTLAVTNTPVTLLTNIIPAFLVCVGLGDSVHVLSVYRDLRQKGATNQSAILSAVGSTGLPVLFTTLTTMVGLLSFRFASTMGIQEMGTFAAGGVFYALFLSVTIIPITLSLVKDGQLRAVSDGGAPDTIDRLLIFCTRLSETPKKRTRTYLATVGVILLAIAGMSRLEVFHDPMTWMATDDPTYLGMTALDEHVGGASNVSVVVEASGELGVKDQELLASLERLETHIREFEHPRTGETLITSSTSILDIVKETNRALHEGDQNYYKLPDNQRSVSDALLLFENAGPEDLRRIATADLAKTHLSMRLGWMDATSYLPLTAHIEEGIETYIGDKAKASTTGSVYSIVSVVGVLIGDMLKSFGVAVLVITCMMVILLRNLKLGVVAMLPSILPVVFILGFMGFVNMPIDLANLLIASVVIGIAVDDTIHYLHQYRVRHDVNADTEQGIAHALQHAGRALVSTSMVLCIGFSAYLAGSMANIRRFGILVACACVSALFTNLILVPALLRSVHGGSDARS